MKAHDWSSTIVSGRRRNCIESGSRARVRHEARRPGLCNCEFPDKKKFPPATGSTGARPSSNCHVQRTTHRSAVSTPVARPSPCTIAIFEKVLRGRPPLVAVSATVCRLQVPGTRSQGARYSDQESANYVAVANSRRASLCDWCLATESCGPGRGVATR